MGVVTPDPTPPPKTLSVMRTKSIGIEPPLGVGWLPEIATSQWGWPGQLGFDLLLMIITFRTFPS